MFLLVKIQSTLIWHFFSWTFDLLLINSSRYLVSECLEFISHHTKEILYVNTNFMGKHFHLFLILILKKPVFRSSLPELLYKNCVLRNLAKFTWKHLCQSLFFNNVAGLRSATLLKKRLWHRCFPVNFAIFLRNFVTSFVTEHRWLVLCFLMQSHEDSCEKFLIFLSFMDTFLEAAVHRCSSK